MVAGHGVPGNALVKISMGAGDEVREGQQWSAEKLGS